MARILDQIVGHKRAMQQLQAAMQSKRLAPTSLYVGPSGVGKKKVALGVAQALVCERDPLGCGQCPSCIRVEKMQSESLKFVEPDGAFIKVDQAKEIIQFVSLQNIGHARAVIIDGAERMNPIAANAILKTLEEPPEGSYFILLTTSLSAILPTIRSRSQTVRFSPLEKDDLRRLGSFDPWILNSCGGSLEQAEMLSQGGDFKKIRAEIFELLRTRVSKGGGVYGDLKDLIKDREQALFLAGVLQKWSHDLFVYNLDSSDGLLNPDQSEWSAKFASQRSPKDLEKIWQGSRRLEQDIRGNVDRQLSFENFFLSLGPQPS